MKKKNKFSRMIKPSQKYKSKQKMQSNSIFNEVNMVSELLLMSGAITDQEGSTTVKRKAEVRDTKAMVTTANQEGSTRVKRKAEVRDTKAMVQETMTNEGTRKRNPKGKEKMQEFNEHDEGDHMFTVRKEYQEGSEEGMWLIDSGCTNHMIANEKLFTRVDTNINVPIRVGNGAVMMSKGKGDIEVDQERQENHTRCFTCTKTLQKSSQRSLDDYKWIQSHIQEE